MDTLYTLSTNVVPNGAEEETIKIISISCKARIWGDAPITCENKTTSKMNKTLLRTLRATIRTYKSSILSIK